MKHYDIAVVGGGNAVTIAMRAAKAGRKVAVVEKDLLGGTCPNRGCIPSKLLLGYAEEATRIRESSRFHIQSSISELDGSKMLTETIAATSGATDGKIAGALEGVDLYRGLGRFVGDKKIAVGEDEFTADVCIIGTGTRPRVVDLPGLAGTPFWTSDDVFEQTSLPKSIVVVGGGYIGCELATFFAGVGVETLVVNRSDVLLPAEDRDIRSVFKDGFTELVDVAFDTVITKVSHDGSEFKISLKSSTGSSERQAEALLFAVGRVPNTDDLGLEAAGLKTDRRGYIPVDARMRTNVPGIYALGDVKGTNFFTHAAAFEATYLGDCLLDGHDEDLDYGPMPHAVFATPEVAGVGATEDELTAQGREYLVAQLPYTSAAKGRAIKEQHGLCKILLNPEGLILGCHLVGRDASILLHEVIPVMKWRNHISSLTGIIHIHPSLSEVVRNTARKAEGML